MRPELDSNQRPSPSQSDVLPLNYQDIDGAGARIRTRNDGFEGRSDYPFHHTCMALIRVLIPQPFARQAGVLPLSQCSMVRLLGLEPSLVVIKSQVSYQLDVNAKGGRRESNPRSRSGTFTADDLAYGRAAHEGRMAPPQYSCDLFGCQ